MKRHAYVTLLYSNDYVPGALVVARRLHQVGSNIHRVVLVASSPNENDEDGSRLSERSIELLEQVYDEIVYIPCIGHDSNRCGDLLGRSELSKAFSKIYVWKLYDRFDKVVFLDADVLIINNIDCLFDRDIDQMQIGAAPDIGWPDIFNSGVFVCIPNDQVFQDLQTLARQGESFDGADQGLLNEYFNRDLLLWQRIPFTFNVTPSSSYQYRPAFIHFESQISVMHFIGVNKPWRNYYNHDLYVTKWWNCYKQYYDDPVPKHVQGAEGQEYEKKYMYEEPPEDNGVGQMEQKIEQLHVDREVHFSNNLMTIAPDPDRWDASKWSPPLESKPEAASLHIDIEHYSNAWDRPAPEKEEKEKESSEEEGSEKEGENEESKEIVEQAEFKFPELGPTVSKFPWEDEQRTPERVFPKMEVDQPEEEDDEQEEKEEEKLDERQVSDSEQGEFTTVEVPDEDFEDDYDNELQEEEDEEEEVHRATSLRDFKHANAWDEIPEIESYVTQHVRRNSIPQDDEIDRLLDIEAPSQPFQQLQQARRKHVYPITPNIIRSFNSSTVSLVDDSIPAPNQEVEKWDPQKKLDELAMLPALLLAAKRQEQPVVKDEREE